MKDSGWFKSQGSICSQNLTSHCWQKTKCLTYNTEAALCPTSWAMPPCCHHTPWIDRKLRQMVQYCTEYGTVLYRVDGTGKKAKQQFHHDKKKQILITSS